MESVKINSGETVLAKETKYGVIAITYANRTQASHKSELLKSKGIDCNVINKGRPFYVKINGIIKEERIKENAL